MNRRPEADDSLSAGPRCGGGPAAQIHCGGHSDAAGVLVAFHVVLGENDGAAGRFALNFLVDVAPEEAREQAVVVLAEDDHLCADAPCR